MKIQNLVPFLLIEGSPATLRQLIARAKDCRVFDILSLDLHEGKDMREEYEPVLKALLAKPPTPPGYPILVSYVEVGEVERKYGIEFEPCIDISCLNPNFQEPPKNLEPYYSNDESVPKGHYNANSNCFHPVLGLTGAEWSSLIDAPVWLSSEKVLKLAPTIEHIVAHIIWEITFMGFTEAECQGKWNEIVQMKEDYLDRLSEKPLDGKPNS